MTEHERGLEREKLDQQIDQSIRSLDVETNYMIENLQQLYRVQQHNYAADHESLQRVRKLLVARLQESRQPTKIVPFAVARKQHNTQKEKTSMMIDQIHPRENDVAPRTRKAGWRRFSRTLSTLAAVVIAALLIGTTAVVLNLNKSVPQSHPSPTKTGSTSKPAAKVDCSIVFSFDVDETRTAPDSGEHTACTEGQETSLNMTKQVGEHTVTLLAAYADANRALIKFAVSDKESLNDGILPGGLGLQEEGTWLTLDQTVSPEYYDQHLNQTFHLWSYNMPEMPATTTSLKMTAWFTQDTAHGSGRSVEMDFTIPFQTAKRVATPNQTTSIDGHGIKLTRVVVTASQTTLYLVPTQTIPTEASLGVLATLNGQSAIAGSTDKKFSTLSSIIVVVPTDLLATQGTWALQVQSLGTPLGVGNGTISFPVPPLA